MAMGIVNNDEFELEKVRLNIIDPDNSIVNNDNIPLIKEVDKGRGNGNIEVPDSLRKIIGITAVEDGRAEAIELANKFGISPSSVSAYSEGATSTASYHERPNLPIINGMKDRVSKRAHGKLMRALAHITDDKLNEAGAGELSLVAKNMGAVIRNMEPPVSDDVKIENKPQFVFFAPTMKKEDSFDVIYSKE